MKQVFCLIAFIAFFTTTSNAQLNLINNQNPTQLVQNYFIGGGIIATNITGSLGTSSSASFSGTVPGISFNSGILLSTGAVSEFILSPGSFHASTNVGMSGDSLLNIIATPAMTYDAQVIEFDFKCTTDSVEFNFIFSSEEYNDYVNSNFNDVFGFFVTGPGYIDNTNVAIIPGTAIPITINNVNNGSGQGTATGPCENCAYYVDNVNTNAIALSPDGFTIPIKIKFAVWPCTDYHFKICIADVGDGIFDSQVMLEENSFLACPVVEPMQNNVAVNNTINLCAGGVVTLTAPDGPSHSWNTGETTQSITITQPGIYFFVIVDSASSCFTYSNSVNVIQQGSIQAPVIVQQNNILTSSTTGTGLIYQWNFEGIPITGANQSTFAFSANGCYTLSVFGGGCEAMSNIICITNTSINEITENSINIIPHPVTGTSIITTKFNDNSISTLKLFDIAGKLLRTEMHKSSEIIFEKGKLSPGLYFIEVSNPSSTKVLKEKILIY